MPKSYFFAPFVFIGDADLFTFYPNASKEVHARDELPTTHHLCSCEMRMVRFYGLHNDLLHLIDGMLRAKSEFRERCAHNNNYYAFHFTTETGFLCSGSHSLRGNSIAIENGNGNGIGTGVKEKQRDVLNCCVLIFPVYFICGRFSMQLNFCNVIETNERTQANKHEFGPNKK